MTAEALGLLLAKLASQHGRLTVLVHNTDGEKPWLATLAAAGRQTTGHGANAFDAIANAVQALDR